MRKNDSLPDLSSWVALRADRPPRVLNLLFWAAVVSTGLTYGFVFLVAPELFPSGDPLVDVVILVIIVCLVVSCALWPLLAWSPSAWWGHRAASVLFLAVSVFCRIRRRASSAAERATAGLATGRADSSVSSGRPMSMGSPARLITRSCDDSCDWEGRMSPSGVFHADNRCVNQAAPR